MNGVTQHVLRLVELPHVDLPIETLGTAIAVDEQHLLTCYHVLRDVIHGPTPIYAIDPLDARQLGLELLYYDEVQDIALLRCAAMHKARRMLFCTEVRVDTQTFLSKLALRSFGFTHRSDALEASQVHPGCIVSVEYDALGLATWFDSSMGAKFGMSGGPLVYQSHKDGQDICLGMNVKGGEGYAVSSFIAADVLVKTLTENKINVRTAAFSRTIDLQSATKPPSTDTYTINGPVTGAVGAGATATIYAQRAPTADKEH